MKRPASRLSGGCLFTWGMSVELIPESLRSDVETLWAYHDMHHEPVRVMSGSDWAATTSASP